MASMRPLLAMLFLCQLAVAEPIADAVNERIPVSRAELETHWQVDCRATWLELQALAAAGREHGQCLVDPGLRRVLELCVYVYQPPGGTDAAACPDYRAALAALDGAAGPGACVALADTLREDTLCPPPGAIP